MLIQFHFLQNYAPSNLNRDDTGAPKDAMFGGIRRGRISSQCIKRSIRRSSFFENEFRKVELLGVRTRHFPQLLEESLTQLGAKPDEVKNILRQMDHIGRESLKRSKNGDEEESSATEADHDGEDQTKQLIFLAPNEVRPIAEKVLTIYRRLGVKDWKKARIVEITKELGKSLPKSVDIAMFGRMTTSEAFEDVNAAVQVAHAISTHALAEEFDYFTAVDELTGEAGAGMIGDVEFNSSTYYKYINVHWEQLVQNLGGDTNIARRALLALLMAAATSQPSGKQNTFAAFNLPDFILVEVSDSNLAVSYANAFLKPVRTSHAESLMEVSIEKLGIYLERISNAFEYNPKRIYLSIDGSKIESVPAVDSLSAMKTWLIQQLPEE